MLLTARRLVSLLATVAITTTGLVVIIAPASAAEARPGGPPAVGTLYVAEHSLDRVALSPPGGSTPTFVGTGLDSPTGVAVDAAGDVFVADSFNNRVVKVPADGSRQTAIGTDLSFPYGVAVDAVGDVFIADTDNSRVVKVPADGGPQADIGTDLSGPYGVAVDAAGDVFIADTGNDRVVKVPADGSPQAVIGTDLSYPIGVAVDAAGDVFIADSFNNRVVKAPAYGGPPVAIAWGLDDPVAVALDAAGNVFIADVGAREVLAVPAVGGTPSVIVSSLAYPTGVTVSAPPPTFTAATPELAAQVGAPYSYSYTAATPKGEPGAQFRISAGALPPGLTLDPVTGVLSGTPTTAGSYTFTAETNNVADGTLAAPATIVVIPGDKDGPVLEGPPARSPAPTANGWNKGPVTLTWQWSDTGSGVNPAACTTSRVVTTTGQVSATCTDQAGNSTTSPTITVRIDAVAPTLAPTVPSTVLLGATATATAGASDTGGSGR